MSKRSWIVPSLVLAFVAGVALAAQDDGGYPETVAGSGYRPDTQSALFRTITTTDTLTTAGILATPEFRCLGKPTIAVSARFTNSGDTCKVRLAYVYKSGDPKGSATDVTKNFIKGFSQEVVLTAGTVAYLGAPFVAPDALFDSEGSVAVRLLVTSAPAASTTFWVGSF